eukprot:COSAG04_NODE_5588_length_1558_cov_0.623715_2_plen_212_part_00
MWSNMCNSRLNSNDCCCAGDTAFVQGGWNAFHHPREPKGIPVTLSPPHPLEMLGHRCLGGLLSKIKCRAVLRLGLRSNSSMINNCHDASLLLQRLRAWVRVRSRARSLRCTGVLASAGAGWAALSSGSTRSKTVRHPKAFAPPNRRDYQIGSRGVFARLTLGRCDNSRLWVRGDGRVGGPERRRGPRGAHHAGAAGNTLPGRRIPGQAVKS